MCSLMKTTVILTWVPFLLNWNLHVKFTWIPIIWIIGTYVFHLQQLQLRKHLLNKMREGNWFWICYLWVLTGLFHTRLFNSTFFNEQEIIKHYEIVLWSLIFLNNYVWYWNTTDLQKWTLYFVLYDYFSWLISFFTVCLFKLKVNMWWFSPFCILKCKLPYRYN